MIRAEWKRMAAVFIFFVVSIECSTRGKTVVASNCTVCREVAQGFLYLSTEWPLIQQLEADTTRRRSAPAAELSKRSQTTFDVVIEKFCDVSFLNGDQQRVCYYLTPFAGEVAEWLSMGIKPDRVCRKLGRRNPDMCFDARRIEPSGLQLVDWRGKPPSIPEGVNCSVEHRNSLVPRWVLFN